METELTTETGASRVESGTRANGARTVIRKASERVCDRITLEAMEQSFPDFVENDKEFIVALQKKTVEHLMAGFEVLWRLHQALTLSLRSARL